MGMYDIIADKENAINEAQSRASEIYDAQIRSIWSILHTDGYAEMKAYFEREIESAKEQLTIAETGDVLRLQEKYKLANWFVTFLNNFESKLKK